MGSGGLLNLLELFWFISYVSNTRISVSFICIYLHVARQEHSVSKDILLEDFQDSYQNLTLKTLHAMKFFSMSNSSSHFTHLLKLDDDTFANILMLERILKLEKSPNFIMGLKQHLIKPLVSRLVGDHSDQLNFFYIKH